MALTYTELKAETDDLYKDRTLTDWKAESTRRNLVRRNQADFDWLLSMYPKKISRTQEMLLGIIDIEQRTHLLSKIAIMKDKFSACVKEVQMRKDGDVVRTDLHGATDYYLDYDGGADINNGLGTGTAKKNFQDLSDNIALVPGDVIYVRANVTWDQGTEATNITFTEDGSQDAYISIIGCDSVTNDPWGDADDTLPIIDFEDAGFQFYFTGENYWHLERLDIIQGGYGNGTVFLSACHGNYFKTCTVRDCLNSGVEGVKLSASHHITIDSCTFINCNGTSVQTTTCTVLVKSSTFNGGGDVSTDTAITATASIFYIEDTTFGAMTTHDNYDLQVSDGGIVYARNCQWNSPLYVVTGGKIYSEDDDETFEAHITTLLAGTSTRGTANARAGGADSYAILKPNANCGVNNPLTLGGNPLSGDFKIWLVKDVAVNISVWARVGTAWDIAIDSAADCYIQASYLSNAASAARTLTSASTETLGNDADWTTGVNELTTGAFTPLQTGWVYVWFYLTETDGVDYTEEVWVDIKPVVN